LKSIISVNKFLTIFVVLAKGLMMVIRTYQDATGWSRQSARPEFLWPRTWADDRG